MIEEVGKFVALMEKPIYKTIAASIVQSGLSVSDLLALTYGNTGWSIKRLNSKAPTLTKAEKAGAKHTKNKQNHG
jgi:hypothetical protein